MSDETPPIAQPDRRESERLAFFLGGLFLNFGNLEHTLSLAIAAAFNLNEIQERTFVRGMFARAKIELLLSFAKTHWDSDSQRLLKNVTDDALKTIDFRNDLAHGTIMHDAKGQWAIITFRGNNRFQGKVTPLTADLVKHHMDETARFHDAFGDLAEHLTKGTFPRSMTVPGTATPQQQWRGAQKKPPDSKL